MRVEVYEGGQRQEWDAFVRAHPHASAGHLSGVFALEEAGGNHNRSLLLRGERDRLAGLLPLFETETRSLRFVRQRRLASGTYLPGGPLLAPELSARQQRDALALLVAEAQRVAAASRADSIAISYPNVAGGRASVEHYGYLPLRHFGFRESNVVSLLADLNSPEETLLGNLKGNCRNMIRRAEREGAQFRLVERRDEWLALEELNAQTLGDLSYPRRVLEVVWDEFVAKGFATVGAAFAGGAVASVVVAVGAGSSCYYWMGFNARPLAVVGANNLALWRTMLLWKGRGARVFELGSMEFSDAKQRRISEFKESFGGRPVYALGGTLELRPAKQALLSLAGAGVAAVRARRRRAAAHEEATAETPKGKVDADKTAAGQTPAAARAEQKGAREKGSTGKAAEKAAPEKVSAGGETRGPEVVADVPAESRPR